jgi:hypothetical protein
LFIAALFFLVKNHLMFAGAKNWERKEKGQTYEQGPIHQQDVPSW